MNKHVYNYYYLLNKLFSLDTLIECTPDLIVTNCCNNNKNNQYFFNFCGKFMCIEHGRQIILTFLNIL